MKPKKRVVAFGFFDGVHTGHAELLKITRQRADSLDAMPSVVSFDIHPDTLVFNKDVPLITSASDREYLIHKFFGIDDVIFLHFNYQLMHMPWKEFIDSLISELDIGWIVVGHDFTFGDKGEGNAQKLKVYSESLGIGCDIIPAVMIDERIVSSTYIRQLIECGKMEEAAKYLGHHHFLNDTVRPGYHLGHKLGAPTINMYIPENVIVPMHGVYATKVFFEDESSNIAVTNIGIRPTVSDAGKVSVESHLVNYSGDLYGRHVRVEFYKFIRPETKFSDLNQLSVQIKKDTDSTIEYFTNTSNI